jgi:hypothetical protein
MALDGFNHDGQARAYDLRADDQFSVQQTWWLATNR